MLDVIAMGLSLGLFAVCFVYLRGCDGLKGGR